VRQQQEPIMRTLLGPGAIGDVVRRVQQKLTSAGFDTKRVDGWFGQGTANALKQFQEAKGLAASGVIDDATWPPLMLEPIPETTERSLQLTASFEGHGFGLAVGNFDGALLTWGIIGFTLTSNEIQEIVLAVNQAHPELVRQAFPSYADELLNLMTAPRDIQKNWADEHTVNGHALAEPWKSMFAAFGAFPEVQAEQLKQVQQDYFGPAIHTARALNFTSELGLALCFDIHVQNGGIKNTAMQQIQQQAKAGMAQEARRVIVANAVADWANPAWADSVRRRKLTVATGQGTVNGHAYVLEDWGLSGTINTTELAGTGAGGAP
jgi:Putative peptidoglycan binding domain/Glycosyl hydrolase family 46